MKSVFLSISILLSLGCANAIPSSTDKAVKSNGSTSISIRLDAVIPTRYISFIADEEIRIAAPSLLGPKNVTNLHYKRSDIPGSIRVKVYKGVTAMGNGIDPYAGTGAEVAGDYIVNIANRIPKDVLASLQKEGGGLRIKIRLAQHGAMLGWDIERQSGYEAGKLDSRGNPIYFRPEYFMAGGDFQEATVFNGKVLRKGWYIHPKTGQKIETDF